ncbi:hypothetical protein HCH_00178 [Hahella chejuensis KCTC 2396]|uniref:Uncharacterized protein n=1 Tax=Hahella chejuensis (strain KCTC 2396) TaxID=349521 RepID=Q2SQH8_HAHCH|nr:hypothetical protein [Hahella chejuensis]ABC27096.1 hypothetical protein HCH_00178 [Hahella chejuensis KCTC 2396]
MCTKQSVGFVAGLALALASSLSVAGDLSIANQKAENIEHQDIEQLVADFYLEYGEPTAAGPGTMKDGKTMRYGRSMMDDDASARDLKWENFGSNN